MPVLMKTTHLFGVFRVLPSLSAVGITTDMMAGHQSKKACPWSFLQVSTRYVHGVIHWFVLLPFLLFLC
jgi:hypothetical protein